MKELQLEVAADGVVATDRLIRIAVEGKYNAVLPFRKLPVRQCETVDFETIVCRPMRLRRIYIPEPLASVVSCRSFTICDREVFHADGDVPGALFIDSLEAFDEALVPGDLVRCSISNHARLPIELMICGLGVRGLAREDGGVP